MDSCCIIAFLSVLSLKPCCVLTLNNHVHKHKLTLAETMSSLTHPEGPERSSLWRSSASPGPLRDLTVPAPASPSLGAGANAELPAPRARAGTHTSAYKRLCPTQPSPPSASYAPGTPSRLVPPCTPPPCNSVPEVRGEPCPAPHALT